MDEAVRVESGVGRVCRQNHGDRANDGNDNAQEVALRRGSVMSGASGYGTNVRGGVHLAKSFFEHERCEYAVGDESKLERMPKIRLCYEESSLGDVLFPVEPPMRPERRRRI